MLQLIAGTWFGPVGPGVALRQSVVVPDGLSMAGLVVVNAAPLTGFGAAPAVDAAVTRARTAAAHPTKTSRQFNHFLIASSLPQGAGRVLCRTQQVGRQFQIRPPGSPNPQTRM